MARASTPPRRSPARRSPHAGRSRRQIARTVARRLETRLLGRRDARARPARPRADAADPRPSGRPSEAPQRPVHDARPRDRRPADSVKAARRSGAGFVATVAPAATGRRSATRSARASRARGSPTLRACGLSERKAEYVRDLARAFRVGRARSDALDAARRRGADRARWSTSRASAAGPPRCS